MYLYLSLASSIIFIFIYAFKKELRREMLWAGLLSFPLFALKFIITTQFWTEILRFDLYLPFIIEAVVFGFTFGGIAAVIFEILFHKKLKTVPHPHRIHLIWLVFGPITFFASAFILQLSFSLCIGLGFLIQALTLLYMRKDLLWDAVISGVFMGLFYLLFYYLFFTVIPGQTSGLWFAQTSGVMVLGLPVEEIAAIYAFGLLWGPLYEGFKGYSLKSDK